MLGLLPVSLAFMCKPIHGKSLFKIGVIIPILLINSE